MYVILYIYCIFFKFYIYVKKKNTGKCFSRKTENHWGYFCKKYSTYNGNPFKWYNVFPNIFLCIKYVFIIHIAGLPLPQNRCPHRNQRVMWMINLQQGNRSRYNQNSILLNIDKCDIKYSIGLISIFDSSFGHGVW